MFHSLKPSTWKKQKKNKNISTSQAFVSFPPLLEIRAFSSEMGFNGSTQVHPPSTSKICRSEAILPWVYKIPSISRSCETIYIRMGCLGSKLESINSPYLISSIITFLTNPRFTGHQRFLCINAEWWQIACLQSFFGSTLGKGIVVDVVGRVMTTRYNKNVLVACTNRWARTNRHRALSS